MKFFEFTTLKQLLVPAVIFVFSQSLSGQGSVQGKISISGNPGSDCITSLIVHQVEFLRNSYSEKNETPEELINGKEYESYYNKSKVKPLLFSGRPRNAAAFTKTRKYVNLILQYDTFLDEVIYTDTSKMINSRFPQIALNKDIIDGFNLYFKDDSLKFRYLRQPEYSARNIEEGYYEIAYMGGSQYIIKHESSSYEREGLVNYNYSPVNYISTGSRFYPVRNKKNMLRLMGDKSREVKKFIRSRRVRIGQASRDQIISVLKYYDGLVMSKQ
jgi:hypothetical protein